MHLNRTARSLIVLLAVASLPMAQDKEPKKPATKSAPAAQEPKKAAPAQEPKKPAASQPAEASHKADAPIMLQFGVTGLTKDNESKVKEGLTAMSTSRYVCEACKVDKAVAGKCPKCNADLSMKKKPVLQGSAAMTDQSSMSVTVAPGNSLSYTDLEGALSKNSVHIDPAKFNIAGKAQLVLRGGMADAVPAIQKALEDAKLFDSVKASFDVAKSEIQVQVQAGAAAPTRAKVASVVEGSGTKLHLEDIVFGAAPAAMPAKG